MRSNVYVSLTCIASFLLTLEDQVWQGPGNSCNKSAHTVLTFSTLFSGAVLSNSVLFALLYIRGSNIYSIYQYAKLLRIIRGVPSTPPLWGFHLQIVFCLVMDPMAFAVVVKTCFVRYSRTKTMYTKEFIIDDT